MVAWAGRVDGGGLVAEGNLTLTLSLERRGDQSVVEGRGL